MTPEAVAQRKWVRSHPEAAKAIRRRWYLKHRAEQIERARNYRARKKRAAEEAARQPEGQ